MIFFPSRQVQKYRNKKSPKSKGEELDKNMNNQQKDSW